MTQTRIGHDHRSGVFVITDVGTFQPRVVTITVDGEYIVATTVAAQIEMRSHWSRLARLDGTPFADVGGAYGYAVQQAALMPAAPAPGDLTVFEPLPFVQMLPTNPWLIDHSFDHDPIVSTFDSSGQQVFGDVTVISPTRVAVSFSGILAGTATLV